jgi:hypothetical protein
VPSGALPSGALPSGAVPSGAVPSGAVPSGALPSGAVPSGAVPSGVVPSGVVPSGAVPDAALHQPSGPGPDATAGPRSRLPSVGEPLQVARAVRVLATPSAEAVAGKIALITVAALVALVAAEVHPSASYATVALALLAFLTTSALIGCALGLRAQRSPRAALLLTTSMRDFAIAAALATAAFGPAAAAPLGLYGVAVLLWGTAVAGPIRRRAVRRE